MAQRKPDEFDRVIVSEDILRENRSQVRELEGMLKADRQRKTPKITEERLVREEIQKHRQILEENAPHKLTGAKANKAYAEAKRLEEEIKKALLPNRTYHQSYPTSGSHSKEMDFQRAVDQQVKLQTDRELKYKMNRLKNIYRQLDPDDPTVANLERFRG